MGVLYNRLALIRQAARRRLSYAPGSIYRDAAWKEDDNVFMASMRTQADKTLDAIEVLMRIVKDMPASDARLLMAAA